MKILPSEHIIEIINEQHWHELRSTHIGASEVAGLFDADDGVDNTYVTRYELWVTKSKRHSVEWEDAERMFWGRTLEDAIGAGLEQKHGMKLQKNKFYFTSPNVRGMGCTPDFIAQPWQGKEGLGVVQIKNVDYVQFKKWRDENGTTPPMQFILQVQQELACTGFLWGILAVFVGGNSLHLFPFDRHEGAIAKIEQAVTDFWVSVDNGIEPKAVSDDYDIVREIYPETDGTTLDLSANNELPQLCTTLINFKQQRLAAEKEEKNAKARIMQLVGNASMAVCQGFIIKRNKVVKQTYIVEAHTETRLTIKEN